MKTDANGCSTCSTGTEQHERFRSMAGPWMIQYDYRHVDGSLFSTVGPDLEVCRKRRDIWLEKKTIHHEEIVSNSSTSGSSD